MSNPYNEALGATLIERTIRERIVIVGVTFPGTDELVVHMDGGSARVALHRPAPGRVTLTGPATYVGSIEVPIA